MKLKAKDYSSQDIEKHVANKYGLTPDQKAHTIAGTRRTRTLGALRQYRILGNSLYDHRRSDTREIEYPQAGQGALHEGGINKPKKRKNG